MLPRSKCPLRARFLDFDILMSIVFGRNSTLSCCHAAESMACDCQNLAKRTCCSFPIAVTPPVRRWHTGDRSCRPNGQKSSAKDTRACSGSEKSSSKNRPSHPQCPNPLPHGGYPRQFRLANLAKGKDAVERSYRRIARVVDPGQKGRREPPRWARFSTGAVSGVVPHRCNGCSPVCTGWELSAST